MRFEDRIAEEAFTKIAALLAAAYQRYTAVRRVCPNAENSSPEGLDKSPISSLHEQ